MPSVSKTVFPIGCFGLLLLLISVEAKADNVTFSTTGTFSCAGSTCKVEGNKVTIGSGDNTIILTFSGLNNVMVDTGPMGTFTSFGQIKAETSGTGATFPGGTQLILTVTQTVPAVPAGSPDAGNFNGTIGGSISGLTSTAQLNFGASFMIGALQYSIDDFKLVPQSTNGGVTSIQGRVGPPQGPVVFPEPEPATMILFGTGILGVAGALRRKRHRL